MQRRVLKSSPAREVRVERDADGGERVVKRFASPGVVARLFDRRRAERELELLAFLAAEGVPVPRPLGLARRAGGFEVASEHLAGRRSLAELLAVDAPPPLATFRALGSALAHLHRLGVDHPDLHPGNVLVAADGALALIDFHAARRRARPSAKRLARDVVSLEAALRERADLDARRALLDAWLAGAAELAAAVPRGAELDRLARERRAAVVVARQKRWLRAGTALAAQPGGLLRHRAPTGLLAALEALRPPDPPDLDGGEIELDGRRFAVRRGSAAEIERAWLASARLEEHALPVARPAAWRRARRAAAAFELPPDAREVSAGSAARRRAAAELLGALCDRGLWIPELARAELRLDAHDRAVLVAPRALEAWPARRGWLARTRLVLSPSELARGFARADRGHCAARVAEELARA